MEYKRLTDEKEHYKKCVGCSYRNCQYCEDKYEYAREVHKRLAELEDKIEQGMLVDTESYFIVEENQWAGKNRFLVCKNAVQLAVCDFCESREEAEKRLKELQE